MCELKLEIEFNANSFKRLIEDYNITPQILKDKM